MKRQLEPILVTARLVLRRPGHDDCDAIVAAANDIRVARWLSRLPHPYRRGDAEAFIAHAGQAAAAGRSLNLSIFRGGRLVGGIGLAALHSVNELGYWLAYDAWGMGYATEASRAVLAYGFAELRLGLVRSGVFAGNEASLRVQTKLGFRRLGFSRRRALALGRTVDHIDTVLTRRRFNAFAR